MDGRSSRTDGAIASPGPRSLCGSWIGLGAIVVLTVTVVSAMAVLMPEVERRADARWEEVVAHWRSRESVIDPAHEIMAHLEARLAEMLEQSSRETATPSPSSGDEEKMQRTPNPWRPTGIPCCARELPPRREPLGPAWWMGPARWVRERSDSLFLGLPGHRLTLTLRQERRWLACDLWATVESNAPVDDERQAAIREAFAEVDVLAVFEVR